MSLRILVTGGAGFIGSNLVNQLVTGNNYITVLDNFDPFYSREMKENNVRSFLGNPNLQLIEAGIEDMAMLEAALGDAEFDVIIHLAAKAGVRPSIEDPLAYHEVNVKGTQNLLEIARKKRVTQFIFTSSSSVYGINPNTPWSEDDHVLRPISPYASTKLSGEFLGHVYSHLYNIRFIALRLFTVYGPAQRPDLAICKFAKAIMHGEWLTMFGRGNTARDYTYVDDIVQGIIAAIDYNSSNYEVINLGNNQTISLSTMIETLEEVFEKKAVIQVEPEQPGDVMITCANISKASRLLNYFPSTSFKEGIRKYREWLTSQLTVPSLHEGLTSH